MDNPWLGLDGLEFELDERTTLTLDDLDLDVRGIGVRLRGCFKDNNINSIDDLLSKTVAELLRTPNVGLRAMGLLINELDHYGLVFENNNYYNMKNLRTIGKAIREEYPRKKR